MNQTAHPALRIDTAAPSGEQDWVDRIIGPYAEMLGRVPGGLRMLSVSPPLLEHYAGTIGYYMDHPRLSQPLTAFIRYLVSWRGDCAYCVDLNEAFLMNAGLDLETIRAARDDPDRAPLPDREKALLRLAVEAVDMPQAVTAERLDALRDEDWTDRDIFDAVWHAALNRAFGRTAEAFDLAPDGFVG